MNLSNPLESLLPANDAAVLRTLSRLETPISGRQVHKLSGSASYSGVRLALRRLAETGILIASREDYATLYSLNRRHVLYGPLAEILRTRETLVRNVRNHFAAPANIRDAETGFSVGFFGSVATHESTAGSDIDLAIVYVDDRDRLDRQNSVRELVPRLESWTGNPVDIYDITREELWKMVRTRNPLVDSWVMSSEPIIGPSLPDLIRRAVK